MKIIARHGYSEPPEVMALTTTVQSVSQQKAQDHVRKAHAAEYIRSNQTK